MIFGDALSPSIRSARVAPLSCELSPVACAPMSPVSRLVLLLPLSGPHTPDPARAACDPRGQSRLLGPIPAANHLECSQWQRLASVSGRQPVQVSPRRPGLLSPCSEAKRGE